MNFGVSVFATPRRDFAATGRSWSIGVMAEGLIYSFSILHHSKIGNSKTF